MLYNYQKIYNELSKAAPTARHSARGPAILDLRVPNPSRIHQVESQKSIKVGSKIHQVGIQNQEKSVLGGVLGGSWAPRGTKTPSKSVPRKLVALILKGFGRVLGPKIDQKPIKSQLKNQSIFQYMLRSIFLGFWHQLGPQNPPKIEPSWDQVAP